ARLENVERAFVLVTSVDVTVQKTSTPTSHVSAMDRMRETVSASLKFIQDASSQIDVPESKQFGDIQSAIDEAIASFDRAQHAEASDSSARSELGLKTGELQRT